MLLSRFIAILPAILLSAYAQEKGGREQPTKDVVRKPLNTRVVFEILDVNKDGKVVFEDFTQADRMQGLTRSVQWIIFNRLDKNSDGELDLEELKLSPNAKRLPPFAEINKDKDDKITFAEFSQHPHFVNLREETQKWIFERLDRDNNGSLSRADLARPKKKKDPLFQYPFRLALSDLDLDRNGKLSFGEFNNAPLVMDRTIKRRRRMFRKIDTNGDQQITRREIRELNELHEQRKQKRLAAKEARKKKAALKKAALKKAKK